MKATGILRRVDDLGRIVIPKEVRHELDIKDGQTLEFFTDKDQLVILQKSDVQDGDKLPCISPGLSAETPLGTIVAKPCTDKENPGLWIELYRPESKVGMALALVEYSGEDKELVTRVWGNAQSEDYTDKVPHNYVEEYFAEDKDRLVQQDNLMACRIARLAEYLADNTYQSGKEWRFTDCDFSIIDEDENLADLNRVKKDACGWYGIKAVNPGFESTELILVSDYYGGGCASMTQLFWDDGNERDNWKKEIEKAIIETLSVQETVTPDTMLLIDITRTEKSNKDVRLEELWRQFGDVPMNPETECIEEDFLPFPAGTNRMDIWHWFDEQHSIGVAYLTGQKGA